MDFVLNLSSSLALPPDCTATAIDSIDLSEATRNSLVTGLDLLRS